MGQPGGNPNIAKLGVRFGAGNRQSVAGGKARASIRAQVRLWASREVDFTRIADPDYQIELLTEGGRRPNPTFAEVIAFKKVLLALSDKMMMESVTCDVDGKHIEKQVNSAATLAELIAKSKELEEAEEANAPTIDGEVVDEQPVTD